jgi:hypothetical protein
MTVYADYQYLVDWNGDGAYSHANSDISAYVLESSFQRGVPDGIPLQAGAGALTLKIDNSSSIFSPDNESSPLYGLISPFLRVRMLMTIGTGAASYMFTGFLEDADPIIGLPVGISYATLKAYGILARIQDEQSSIELQEDITTGWLFGALMNAAGISAGDYDAETGKSAISKYWQDPGTDLLSSIRDLESEELGHIVETPEGKAVFWDRSHYFQDSRSSVIQATYGTGILNIWNLQRINSLRSIYNYVSAEVKTFNVTDEEVLLITISDVPNGLGATPLIIPAGGSLVVTFDFPGPESPGQYIGVDSWGIVDYQANSERDGTGDDLTSDLSETTRTEQGSRLIVVFHNAAAVQAHLVVLRAHGIAIVAGDRIPISASDSTSIAKYGRRPFPFAFNWITDQVDGQAKLDYVISEYKDPRARISFDVRANYDLAHLTEVQTRREGDRIRVVAGAEFGLFLDKEFIVDAVIHRIGADRIHVMTLYCTEKPKAQLAADGTARVPNEIPDAAAIEKPDQLWAAGFALEDSIFLISGCNKWNSGIYEAEIRAKRIESGTAVKSVDLRTAGEGGTFVHNGTDQVIVTGLFAEWQGLRHQLFYGAYPGIWYWAARLKNASGWSNWTDGNTVPQHVVDSVNTEGTALVDIGPPANWKLQIKSGVQEGTVVVAATRPRINGKRIMGASFQIRDSSAGAWRNIDADAGASDVLYDGSEIDHAYDPITGILSKTDGDYEDAIADGGLLLIDVRGEAFDHRCTIWRQITADQIDATEISGILPFAMPEAPNANGLYSKLRIKIVRPPWVWNATMPAANVDGFAAEAGYRKRDFVLGGMAGDLDTDTFLSAPIPIPDGITIQDLEARVWFENIYSASDDENHDAEIIDAASLTIPVLLTATMIGIGTDPPVSGPWAMIRIPCDLIINGITLLADQAGSIQLDVRRCLYTAYPDGPGDSIVASAPPLLSSAQAYQDYTLTGWTRTLDEGDVLVIYVAAGASGILRATLTIDCRATVGVGSGAAPGSNTLPIPWGYWPMDEVSQFQVDGAPSAWWYGAIAGGGRFLYFKHTFQLVGDQESLANGDAFGPIYIPPGKAYSTYWKEASRTIGIGDWAGGAQGAVFYDDAAALQNLRIIGYKIYTNSIDGGAVGIKGWQAIYRATDESTVYGTLRGHAAGETENEFILSDDEYITQIKGYRSGPSSFSNRIYQLEFVTNLGSHIYGTATGTAFTLNLPVPSTAWGSHTFAGLWGNYATNPIAIRRIGLLYCIDTFDSAQNDPDDVIGWNAYMSEDGITYTKQNGAYLGLGSVYEEGS